MITEILRDIRPAGPPLLLPTAVQEAVNIKTFPPSGWAYARQPRGDTLDFRIGQQILVAGRGRQVFVRADHHCLVLYWSSSQDGLVVVRALVTALRKYPSDLDYLCLFGREYAA